MKEFKRVIRFKNNVSDEIVKFVKMQENFSEAMTYLIEKEIYENGMRNLVNYVPIIRTDEYFEAILRKEKSTNKEKSKIEVVEDEPKTSKKNVVLDDGYSD